MMPCRDLVLPAVQRNWEMPRLPPVLGAVVGSLNHGARAAMILLIAVLAASPVRSQTLDGQAVFAKQVVRLSSGQAAPAVVSVEDVLESGRAVRTQVVIGPLMEGGVCRRTFHVFPMALDPSERDVVGLMQETPPLTALAVPRDGACDDAQYFTLIGMAPSDGIRLVQSFLRKYDGVNWAPDGAGDAMYMHCLKAGRPLELKSLDVSTALSGEAGKVFFSNLGNCGEGGVSVSVRFKLGNDGDVSVWMQAVNDRLSDAVAD